MTVLTACEAKKGINKRCATWPKCCNWMYREQEDGIRRWRVIKKSAGLTETQAEKWATAQRHEAGKITLGLAAPPKVKLPLLSVYIARYEATDEVKQHATFTTKLHPNLASFLAFVKDRPVSDVTVAMIEAWRDDLLTKPSKKSGGTMNRNTVERKLNSVRGLFRFIAAKERAQGFVNPCPSIPAIGQDPAERVLWPPELLWLIEELPTVYRLPLKVGRLCGCRRTEALTLTKHDLSPVGFSTLGPSGEPIGWIAIRRLKKRKKGGARVWGKERVPIALTIVEELRALLRTPFQLQVFDPMPDPDAWSSLLTRKLRALGRAHGVDVAGLCMHGTRHTATTEMQDTPGVSSKAAQAMGGWTSTRMVETYSRPTDAALLAAADGLAQTYKAGLARTREKGA